MSKKNAMPEISEEEFNSMIGMDYLRTGTGKDTEASILTDYGEITTPKSNPQSDIGEKRTKSEPTGERERVVANAVSAARAASLATGLTMPTMPTEPTEPTDEPAEYFVPGTPSIIPPEESVGSGTPKVPSVPTAITSPDAPELSSTVNTPVAPELSSTVSTPPPPDPSATRPHFLRVGGASLCFGLTETQTCSTSQEWRTYIPMV